MGASSVQEGMEILKENHIPIYETPEEAIKTYLYMYRYKRNLELLYETPAELPVDQSPPKNNLKAFIRRTMKEGRRILTEEDSKNFLRNYGIPITTPFIVNSIESAAGRADRIGYPVVLKVVSPDILPESEVGAAAVHCAERLRPAYESLLERVGQRLPERDDHGRDGRENG